MVSKVGIKIVSEVGYSNGVRNEVLKWRQKWIIQMVLKWVFEWYLNGVRIVLDCVTSGLFKCCQKLVIGVRIGLFKKFQNMAI